ncbi:cilia- and flagella-associated protein 91-like [Papilio machaon]|uniref:cilia- and flagella-associated protein 91-like n=1 Tax=Papilio machaon TaxID=76193 RepID=UPI001E6659F0|nr:cilia- and flagella-associated protein 91-like [Papilio machaon]
MSGDTIYEARRKCNVSKMRAHDYLFDTSYVVSGARDYARAAFKAAMSSAQVTVHPVYNTMFSELREYPRVEVVYHPNCRLPSHVDCSYGAYQERQKEARSVPLPDPTSGKYYFTFCAVPKKMALQLKSATPDFKPPTPYCPSKYCGRPKNKGTQSLYRESSAQTIPWQSEARPADDCETTPEVLFLDKLQWGPGHPYRQGDLPADFHTTEIINKMRHARKWMELVDKGQFPGWMKKRDDIIKDVETKDWIFREAEIDELQDIRLVLLHRLQTEQRRRRTSRVSNKLAKLWQEKKKEMDKKVEIIRRTRDRELRKLSARHSKGGRAGVLQEMKASRGGGSPTVNAYDPTSMLHAPLSRNGYQARRRHAEITYDPSLLVLEDHQKAAEPPAWLERCGQDLKHSCSGHHLPRNTTQLCERETKWSEKYLKNLHDDLKKARLGATVSAAGPLRVLKPRRQTTNLRPPTPEVEAVDDEEEDNHQHALLLQKIIRGRAVQNLMFEGRTRAAELTEELKTTHGLQKEDKARIAREEARARDHIALRTETEQKEDAVTALVDELCGGAVAAALDFLEKELRRLKEERKHHAFILIALREKTMREAAEAGRRQKEEHRRREHDEMFKRVLGVTQETVDAYLKEIVQEGVELASEEDAVKMALGKADKIDEAMRNNGSMSTAEQNELVAELVQQFLLPEAHKAASRHRISAAQESKVEAARKTIFELFDESTVEGETCTRCGALLDDECRCRYCKFDLQPIATVSRDDPRWKKVLKRPQQPEKSFDERIPLEHELRYKLNDILHDAVTMSRRRATDLQALKLDFKQDLYERYQVLIDARQAVDDAINRAMGVLPPAVRRPDQHYFMIRRISDALSRTEPYPKSPCPKELPSEIRRRAEEKSTDITCRCEGEGSIVIEPEDTSTMLPSQLRALEDLKRCKCDAKPQQFDDTEGSDTAREEDTEKSFDEDEGRSEK